MNLSIMLTIISLKFMKKNDIFDLFFVKFKLWINYPLYIKRLRALNNDR